MGRCVGGSRDPKPPSQGNPPTPATCLPGGGGVQTGKAERQPMPARLHCPMVPQDAEGQLAQKASRGPLQARKGQGLGAVGQDAKATANLGYSFHTAHPQTAPQTVLYPSSPQQTALSTQLMPVYSPWPGSQDTTKPQARPEISRQPARSPLWAKENHMRQMSMDALGSKALLPQPDWQRERFPAPPTPAGFPPQAQSLGVHIASSSPNSQERIKKKQVQQDSSKD